jgi:transcriptional regulator with XRE-family HTH domain
LRSICQPLIKRETLARRTVAKDGPHPIDVHVGSRVRRRRTLLGMNQTQLGEKLGITYQQILKYENGANRISASRLYQMTRILDVPVSFFFDGLDEGASAWSPDDIWLNRETLNFVRAYYRIGDPAARKGVFVLTKAMANLA